jgi:hypothetical protein
MQPSVAPASVAPASVTPASVAPASVAPATLRGLEDFAGAFSDSSDTSAPDWRNGANVGLTIRCRRETLHLRYEKYGVQYGGVRERKNTGIE